MEQMKIDPDAEVHVDYENERLTNNLKLFRPTVFTEGDSYCCLLGPDPTTGIFGCGSTAEAAMFDWDNQLNEYIVNHPEGDPLAEFVLDTLATSKGNVW